MATPERRVAQFVVMTYRSGFLCFLSPSGLWFSAFDRAMLFEKIEDAFAACREPGCRVGVAYGGEPLPGKIVPPSEISRG